MFETTVRARQYASPEELVDKVGGPYKARWWRKQVYNGRIQGALKPGGKHGRLWIPLDEAQALLKQGPPK